MRLIFAFIGLFFVIFQASGQKTKLAEQYFLDREYEKAGALYDELLSENRKQGLFFERYVECMLVLEEYDKCESAIKRRIKDFPNISKTYVIYGKFYDQKTEFENADRMYDKAIQKMKPNRGAIISLGNTFNVMAKYERAIQTYERGVVLLKDTVQFAYYLADLYSKMDESDKMIRYHLISLQQNPQRLAGLKKLYVNKLDEEDFLLLQQQLYIRIQEKPAMVIYPEMLLWTFLHQKDYYGAYQQARALDRRLGENGARVFDLGQVAMNAREYETAIEAFDYIIENKSISYGLYVTAKEQLLKAKRRRLYATGEPSETLLRDLEQEYIQFLDEFGRTAQTANFMLQLARFQVYYLNETDKAIELMTSIVELSGIDTYVKANAKLDLGDWYLVKGERWEATLLYSQVDKDFPEEILGEEARYRNAKLSYYVGDFEWAQEQFKVLKAATSKLISNDAIDLSVFIMDNLGLDTTPEPLKMYANADLLLFQGQNDAAFAQLDDLEATYPGHALKDDILYMKARSWVESQEIELAIGAYEQIINDHNEEIRFDNALWELAQLYDYVLNNPELAIPLYERLFIENADSVFATEARKRYREIRGDFDKEDPAEKFMKGL
jgi:tetratricopeptide (TPR) repeat protein